MKIVHVAEAFAGGIPVFIKSLVDNMTDDSHIIIHGDRPYVTSAAIIKKRFIEPNVRFIAWTGAQRSIHPYKDLIAFFQLFAMLRRLRNKELADVIHLHSSKAGFLGRLVCRLLGMKNVVYTPNGAPFMVGTSRFSNTIYRRLEQVGSRLGGKVVCCSLSEQVAYRKAGIQAMRINNGIDLQGPAVVFPALQPEKKLFRIVSSGRIVHQKNPDLFNKVASYFEDLAPFEFVWIGDGPLKHLLTAPNITVTGWMPVHIAKAMMADGDIYLSTANFEGMSFSVLEALSLKKPVLLSNCVGNQDLVDQGLNGDLFKNENEAVLKILRYFNNRAMLKTMGDHSSRHCEESFDVKDTYGQYHQLYQQIATTQSKNPALRMQYT